MILFYALLITMFRFSNASATPGSAKSATETSNSDHKACKIHERTCGPKFFCQLEDDKSGFCEACGVGHEKLLDGGCGEAGIKHDYSMNACKAKCGPYVPPMCPDNAWIVPPKNKKITPQFNWECCAKCPGGTRQCYSDCNCRCSIAKSCEEMGEEKMGCVKQVGCLWKDNKCVGSGKKFKGLDWIEQNKQKALKRCTDMPCDNCIGILGKCNGKTKEECAAASEFGARWCGTGGDADKSAPSAPAPNAPAPKAPAPNSNANGKNPEVSVRVPKSEWDAHLLVSFFLLVVGFFVIYRFVFRQEKREELELLSLYTDELEF